jgi:hypothetical protein
VVEWATHALLIASMARLVTEALDTRSRVAHRVDTTAVAEATWAAVADSTVAAWAAAVGSMAAAVDLAAAATVAVVVDTGNQ